MITYATVIKHTYFVNLFDFYFFFYIKKKKGKNKNAIVKYPSRFKTLKKVDKPTFFRALYPFFSSFSRLFLFEIFFKQIILLLCVYTRFAENEYECGAHTRVTAPGAPI